jgi:hypothetical protein
MQKKTPGESLPSRESYWTLKEGRTKRSSEPRQLGKELWAHPRPVADTNSFCSDKGRQLCSPTAFIMEPCLNPTRLPFFRSFGRNLIALRDKLCGIDPTIALWDYGIQERSQARGFEEDGGASSDASR